MRHLFLVAVVAVAAVVGGCAAQGLPIEGGNGSPGGGGGGTGGVGSQDDMSKPLGDVGAMCSTACDCMPGLACQQGTCGKSMFGPLYCCDSMNCPSGQFCQSSAGMFNQCGAGGSGGFGGGPGGPPFFGDMQSFPVDGGAGSFCRAIKCAQDSDCMAAGCTSCGRRGNCRP